VPPRPKNSIEQGELDNKGSAYNGLDTTLFSQADAEALRLREQGDHGQHQDRLQPACDIRRRKGGSLIIHARAKRKARKKTLSKAMSVLGVIEHTMVPFRWVDEAYGARENLLHSYSQIQGGAVNAFWGTGGGQKRPKCRRQIFLPP